MKSFGLLTVYIVVSNIIKKVFWGFSGCAVLKTYTLKWWNSRLAMLSKFHTIVIILVVWEFYHCPDFRPETTGTELWNSSQLVETIMALLQISLPVVSCKVI